MARLRSTKENTPVKCRYCGMPTTEAMASIVIDNDECGRHSSGRHKFIRQDPE